MNFKQPDQADQPENNNNPYPGLRPYREDEKNNFFGRDADREILVDKLLGHRLTLLFAATGVGKSSLLQAAVMPQLKAPLGENLTVIYHNDWVLKPIDALKQSIINGIKTQDIPLKEQQTLPELLELCTLFTRHPLVIILDQFEEFFRYQKQGGQFHSFISQLTSLVINTQLPLSLVISMREDFALELDAFKPKLPTLLFENYYRIDKLSEDAARQAIEIPAKRSGFRYESALFKQLLNDLLSRDLDRTPSTLSKEITKTVEPPYIQIICAQLWELEKDNPNKTLRLKTYQAKGGATGLLKNYVHNELSQFSRAEKNIASYAFDHLVSRRGTKMPHTVEDLAQIINKEEKELKNVFTKLTAKRILRSQKRADKIWYELYHDLFSQVIEEWNLRWKTNMRNRRFMVGGASTVIVLFILYAGFDYWNNAAHYQLLSKNKAEDQLEVYQGKLDADDLFHQQHYLRETRYQRKQMEPDKCVTACGITQYKDLNTELITNLPLLERITAYAEDGQFKQAIKLVEKTLENKDRKNSVVAVTRLANIRINQALPKLVNELKYNKSSSIRKTIEENMPAVATETLLAREGIDKGLKSKNRNLKRYLFRQRDWIQRKKDLKNITETIIITEFYSIYTRSVRVTNYNNYSPWFFTFGLLSEDLIIKLLSDKNNSIASAAAAELGELKSKKAIQLLIKTLANKDNAVVLSAVIAIRKLKRTEAIQPLIKALVHKDEFVRRSAASALGELKSTEAIQPLIKALLVDKNLSVRLSAASALGELKSTEAIQALIKALVDKEAYVRGSAAFELGKLKSTEAIQALIKALVDKDEFVREYAAFALGELKSTEATQPLVKALADENNRVRTSVVIALGKLKNAKVLDTLIEILSDKDKHKHIHRSVIVGLGKLKSIEALTPLIKALADKNVRDAAVFSLGELKNTEALHPLIKLLADDNEVVRESVVKALGKLKSTEALHPLIKLLADDNEVVRESVVEALGKLKSTEALHPLIKLLADDNEVVRASIVDALGKLKSTEVLHLLIKALASESEDIRSSVPSALGELKSTEALSALLKALGDKSENVRDAATIALLKFNSPKVIEILIPLIFNIPNSSEKKFRKKSIKTSIKTSRKTIATIAKKYKLNKLTTWLNKIEKNYPLPENNNKTEKEIVEEKVKKEFEAKTPQQLQQQINNSKAILAERIEALDRLVEIKPELAKQTLLTLLPNEANEANFGTRLYPYLADVKATEAIEIIQQRLNKIDQEWRNWRIKRDNLTKNATDEQRNQLEKKKPQPMLSPFVYTEAIARLDADKGIKLLQHNLAEARRGAWEGLAQLGDVELVKKLDKIRQANPNNPILRHAAFRAIDLSLLTIEFNVYQQDRAVLDAYLSELKQQGRIVTSDDLAKNDAVAMRIEWTRDRIDEGLQSMKRVECRAEHWFETEWPEGGCP